MKEHFEPEDQHVMLGAYASGGLAASERESFRRHLEWCRACQAEVVVSRSLPGRLDLFPAEEASALPGTPPQQAPAMLGDQISRRSCRNRWLGVGGVAASLLTGILISPAFAPTPTADASHSVPSSHGLILDLSLNSKTWGAELSFIGARLPTTGQLSRWVVDDSGTVDRTGRWMAPPNGHSRITGAVPTPLAKITPVQLRDTDGRVLADVAVDDGP